MKNVSLTLNARRVNSSIFIHKRFQPALKGEVIIRRGSQRRSRICVTSILINLSYVRFCFGFQVLIFYSYYIPRDNEFYPLERSSLIWFPRSLWEPRSIDVPVYAHILKSRSTVLSRLCPLMLYTKTKQGTNGRQHLNKRWELQLIIRKATTAAVAQRCHDHQWEWSSLRMWDSFLPSVF